MLIAAGGITGGTPAAFCLDPPHDSSNSISCDDCHISHGAPGLILTSPAGIANLCISCHTSGGLASSLPFADDDRADPYGTNPAPDNRGTSHAWGVPVVNSDADAQLPLSGSMSARIFSGDLVCSTCHNQHNHNQGTPFLRIDNTANAICKDCHRTRDVTDSADGSHPVGVTVPVDSYLQSPASLILESDNIECTTCHSPHYTDSGGANSGAGDGYILDLSLGSICYDCHTYDSSSTHLDTTSGALWPGGGLGSDFPARNASERGFCINCHWAHGWPDDGSPGQDFPHLAVEQTVTDIGVLNATPDPADANDLCLTCHQAAQGTKIAIDWGSTGNQHGGGAAAGSSYGDLIDPYLTFSDGYSNNIELACTDCHEPHGATSNISLIRDSVNESAVSFNTSNVWWSLCEACHSINTGGGSHPAVMGPSSTCGGGMGCHSATPHSQSSSF